MQVLGDADRVEPQAEGLGVLGLLEGELGQVHLIAQTSLGAHRLHEGLDVLRHRLLARDEQAAEGLDEELFVLAQLRPVPRVLGEVDVRRVPELLVAAHEELERQRLPVETALREGTEPCAGAVGGAVGGDVIGHAVPPMLQY